MTEPCRGTRSFVCLVGTALALLPPAAPEAAAQEPAAPAMAVEWPYVGGDAANTRYSAADTLTPDTVDGLEPAWTWRPADRPRQEFGTIPGVVWSFHTIPQEGEFGSRTWENEAWRHMGATNVWAGVTVEEARGPDGLAGDAVEDEHQPHPALQDLDLPDRLPPPARREPSSPAAASSSSVAGRTRSTPSTRPPAARSGRRRSPSARPRPR